jgi:hypothetical protein
MELKTKNYILNNLNVGRDYSEEGTADYSGRCMYGKTTHAIVIEYSNEVEQAVRDLLEEDESKLQELLDADVIKEAWDEDDSDFEIGNGCYDLHLALDNLGLDYITY